MKGVEAGVEDDVDRDIDIFKHKGLLERRVTSTIFCTLVEDKRLLVLCLVSITSQGTFILDAAANVF